MFLLHLNISKTKKINKERLFCAIKLKKVLGNYNMQVAKL